MLDRTVQRKKFLDALATSLTLQDESDAAADVASATRNALPAATTAYTRAKQAFDAGFGSGASVDQTKSSLLLLQAADPINTQKAQAAYVKWAEAYTAAKQYFADLTIDPGREEQV